MRVHRRGLPGADGEKARPEEVFSEGFPALGEPSSRPRSLAGDFHGRIEMLRPRSEEKRGGLVSLGAWLGADIEGFLGIVCGTNKMGESDMKGLAGGGPGWVLCRRARGYVAPGLALPRGSKQVSFYKL